MIDAPDDASPSAGRDGLDSDASWGRIVQGPRFFEGLSELPAQELAEAAKTLELEGPYPAVEGVGVLAEADHPAVRQHYGSAFGAAELVFFGGADGPRAAGAVGIRGIALPVPLSGLSGDGFDGGSGERSLDLSQEVTAGTAWACGRLGSEG